MKKFVLLAVMMIAISIIALGTITGASSEVKDPKTVFSDNGVAQAAGVSGTVAAVVKTVQLTPKGAAGNYRYPGVAEDSKGNRLVIFRGASGKEYDYVYCPKGGTWSAPKPIASGDQPALTRSNTAHIVVDSKDRFHCTWEESKGGVYASFLDGKWTTPFVISSRGRFDIYHGLAIRSNDDVLFTDTEVVSKNKEIFIHVKGKDDSRFGKPFNLTRDKYASAESSIAVDSKDNSWVVWKSDYYLADPTEENLVTYMGMFKKDNTDGPVEWMVMSPNPGWAFFGSVAVNSEDKVMVISSSAHSNQTETRLYDIATKKLGPIISMGIGLCKKPWHNFYTRLVAHGKDFYAAVLNGSRILVLMKYDEETSKWNMVSQISNVNAEQFDLYNGYDQLLIAWNQVKEPAVVFLTTVGVEPYNQIRVMSPINLKAVKAVERTFFHAYYLNNLSWEANPDNAAKGVVVTAQRIYRKARTEDDTKWLRIAQVAPTVFTYEDSNIAADSDYVYAVTCVDDKENESNINSDPNLLN
jgi:hypothetical protein